MSEVSYSNVPPMMAAIRGGDIETLRSLLHAGHSPNEPQCYQVTIGAWLREEETSPLELAVLENRMDMVQLLIESGADLTHNPEELLYGSLRSPDLTLFSFLVDAGAVSYTHLDQTMNQRLEQMMPELMQAAGVTEELKAREPMTWVGPVSYTHLDVYKRQALGYPLRDEER